MWHSPMERVELVGSLTKTTITYVPNKVHRDLRPGWTQDPLRFVLPRLNGLIWDVQQINPWNSLWVAPPAWVQMGGGGAAR